LQRDPTYVAAHHFYKQYATVAFGSCVKPVDGLCGDAQGGVKAKGQVSANDVVVNGLRNTDHRDSQQRKLIGCPERAFAANSAHELRTPIAGTLAQLQRLIAELEGHPEQDRARQVEQSLVRLRQLADRLLQLARADAGMARASGPAELLPALRVVVEDVRRRLPADRPLQLEERAPSLLAPIDIDAFGIVMRNLIDNALAHGAVERPIEITQEEHAVEVRNGGPVIPPPVLAGLTRRFERGTSRPGGVGLGLAIVETIMRQTGGELLLRSPAPGHSDGFSARIVWH